MTYHSDDSSINVVVSDEPDATGNFSVSANQLVEGNLWALIKVDFGGKDNFTTLNYKTQDPIKAWRVKGSHNGDVVRNLTITITHSF